MAFWFGKKKQSTELREAVLPGDMGKISFPADFVVEMEDEKDASCPTQGNRRHHSAGVEHLSHQERRQ